MQDLEITWPGGVARFSPADSPVQIGRSSAAAVALTEGSVSRRHLELTWDGSGWNATDSSTHGTFDPIGVRLAPTWAVSGETTVKLGGVAGVEVGITPVTTSIAIDDMPPAPLASSELFPASVNGSSSRTGHDEGAGRIVGSPADPPGFDPEPPVLPSIFADPGEPAADRPPADDRSNHSSDLPPLDRLASSYEPPTPVLESADRLEASSTAGPSGLLDPKPAGEAPPPPESPTRQPPLEGPGPTSGPVPSSSDAIVPGATGGHPAIRLNPNTTIISDSTLRLNIDGQDYSFLPGAEVSVGRDPSCLVQLDERHSLVSRRHINARFDDGNWWLEDTSSKGTFIDGRQLKGRYKAEGVFIAHLGDIEAGTPMRVIAAGEHRPPRNLNMGAVVGLALLAIVPIIVLLVLLTRGGSNDEEPDFATAKQSTVMLFGLDGGQGSGFFVSDDLIVTNQHVAVLSPQMLVGVSRDADEPAQIEYATELVANHPFLDIAVLRVSNKATTSSAGTEISADAVGDIGLPAVTIGDSSELTIGEDIFTTGFPGRLSITSTDETGELRLPPVAATSGIAANFAYWPGCSNPDSESFIPADSPAGVACSAGGDVRRGVLLSTFSSGQGASGSAVFHDNEVVAVVYAGDADSANASLSITTAAFSEWLQEIVDEHG